MKRSFFLPRVAILAIASALTACLALSSVTAASASEEVPSYSITTDGDATTVTMQLQGSCQTLNPRAKAYAVEHGICPAPGEVSALADQTFNCGTAKILVRNYGHAGQGWIYYGFSSSLGTVVSRGLTVSWSGSSASGGFPDNSIMFATSYYTESAGRWMGPGWVTAVLQGGVTLIWGAGCNIPPLIYNGTV